MVEQRELRSTSRAEHGFGSTDAKADDRTQPDIIPFDEAEIDNIVRSFSNVTKDIYLSCDPFGPTITVPCPIRGVYPLLGMQLDDSNVKRRLYLRHCEKGTASARIRKWRSMLRGGVLLAMDDIPVSTLKEVQTIVERVRSEKKSEINLTFGTEEKVSMHPDYGTPQLYFDQLNVIANYLQDIRDGDTHIDLENDDEPIINYIITKKRKRSNAQFTRQELKKRQDWKE